MGASASALPDLPPHLRDDDIQKLTGKDFDKLKGVCNAFKKEDGTIDTQEFMQLFHNEEETEVYHLYEYYSSKDGLLGRFQFLSLCRDAKFLQKTQFSASQASGLFLSHCDGVEDINYFTFRKLLLPEIANGLGMSLAFVLTKLAQVEVEIDFDGHGTNFRTQSSFDKEEDAFTLSPSSPGGTGSSSGSHMKAALRLQSFQRRVSASRHVTELQENHRIKKSEDEPTFGLDHPLEGSDDEVSWRALFDKFCPSGELDATDFVSMCRDVGAINKKLTSTGARLVFNRTKAICESPGCGGVYKDGLVFKKRVTYIVFRDILIPLLLKRGKLDEEDFTAIVNRFLSRNPKVLQKQKTFDIVKACF